MSETNAKLELAKAVIDVLEHDKNALLYFRGGMISVKSASLDHDMHGLLICETINEEVFSIDINALEAVLEQEPPTFGFDL